jgi:AraC-like DNA-binding protein
LIDRFDWYPLYIPLVAIIYFLGAKGYFIGTAHRKQSAPNSPDKKPAPLSIPKEKVDQTIEVLRRSMEEDKIWLNADLSLGKLAQYCGVSPKNLSTILNHHLKTSFADYVNHYRIDAVKERIVKPESRQLTIAGLAYECGFNSLPTFQRAFKSTTGQSPREYLAKGDQFRN